MFKISCFADEISNDFDEQIAFMNEKNIKYICLRTVFDKNILLLTDEEVLKVKKILDENGIKVSSIGSPIGKSEIEKDENFEITRIKRAVEIAKMLDCKFIRAFSYFVKQEDYLKYQDEVISRLRKLVAICEEAQIVLLHENESHIYGEHAKENEIIFQNIKSDYFKAAFDPANYISANEKPYTYCFPKVKNYIGYFHVKDKIFDGEVMPAGEGDGEVLEIIRELKDQDLFMTLEPHLAYAGASRGFSGAECFARAHTALIKILDELNIDYI